MAAMEIGVARRKITRETSPDRARTSNFTQQKDKGKNFTTATRKVQIVYYLSRNGQLEHPHFMEISHLPHQILRLKDVIERLTVLRGKGMHSLFSWSCKRSYKNGYVWNDLSENDLIYPVDGAEYVLKGSEIINGGISPKSDRMQHLQLGRRTQIIEAEELEEEEAGKHTGGDLHLIRSHRHTEIALDDSSPPSSSSSDKGAIRTGCASFRFDDGEPAAEPGQSRNSVLLQLISCGTIAVRGGRAAGGGFLKSAAGAPAAAAARKSSSAAAVAAAAAEENYVSEKEYFSGSIVEGMAVGGRRAAAEPALKKSSSYNEERGAKLGIGAEEGENKGEAVRGKCIPGRKRSSAKQQ